MNKVAVVTGGGGPGIGSAVCAALAGRGYLVCVVDVDAEAAEGVAGELTARGGAAEAAAVDVADAEAVQALVASVAQRHGRVDVLVNSAGIGLNKPAADVSVAEYDRVMAVNLRGAWAFIKAVVPHMAATGGGVIVNIGSVHGLGAEEDHAVYATTKAGLVGLTRAVARDYGHAGIRCNIVHPGAVDSPQTRQLCIERGEDPDIWLTEFRRTKQMLPIPVEARHVGAAVAFLASDEAAPITGTELVVDGGLSAMLWDRE